jgi:hypothetical protein
MLFYEPYRTARRFLLNRNMERVSLSVFFSVERGRSFPLRPQADLDHSGFPCAFSVEPLQSRINCRARSVNRHGYLGGLFAGVQESIKLGFLVGSPSARCGFHFSAFRPEQSRSNDNDRQSFELALIGTKEAVLVFGRIARARAIER